MSSKQLARVLLPVLVLAVACGGGHKKKPVPTTTTTTAITIDTPSAPLTGLPQPDPARLARPALMVKVDNVGGFPLQEGVDRADIVIVEQTEQGTTRLAAVFQSQDATVGPVRSARTSDVGIAGALNHPLLAYSGANGGVLGQLRRGPLVDAGIDASGITDVYTSNQRGNDGNLYRYFLPTAQVYDRKGKEGGTPPALFSYRKLFEPSGGDPVHGVHVGYGGGAATNVEYAWNGHSWDRTQNGAVHQMANNGPHISPANVVVLTTPYKDSGFTDVTGAASPQAVLEGSGDAWFLSDGKVVHGRWSRPGPTGPFTFTGPFGTPVLLTPGQTFIELAPGTGSAQLRP